MKKFGYSNFQVFINGKDVTDGVTITEIYMDITNPCWNAKISFLDSVNLINKLPIQKNDKVKIIIETKNIMIKDSKEFNFIIYSISDKIHMSQHSVNFTVNCVSEPLITNLTINVSRHLKGEPSSLISNLFNEYFKNHTCSSSGSSGQVNMTANGWKPFNTFGQLLKYTHKNNIADYLLVQTTDKDFSVKSITDMYNDLTDIKFRYLPNAIGESVNYPYLIYKYEVQHFDAALNLSSGYYGSDVYSYDLTDKKFTNKEFSNENDKEKLSDGEDFSNQNKGRVIFQPMHQNITDDSSQLCSFNTWLPSRKASLLKLEQEKLLIQTAGNIDLVKIFGKSCMVEIPKQDYLSREQLDEKRSGKHLVTAMGLIFNKRMFLMNLELVKREFENYSKPQF